MPTSPTPTQPTRRQVLAAAALALTGCGRGDRDGDGGDGGNRPSAAARAARDEALAAYPPSPAGAEIAAPPEVHARVQALGGGVNFGNMLEAPNEGDWGLRVEDAFIALVGDGGFTRSVRLPVRWSNHASTDAAAVIEPAFMARVQAVVQALLDRGATVVLNMHHYRQLDGANVDPGETPVDPAVVDLRFLAMWRQIAERFANQGPALWFELYNEPHNRLEPWWNDLLSRALRVVRASNPSRLVVVGPTSFNTAGALPRLVLPPDPGLVLTVHHYEPFTFTHQGASWIQPPPPTGTACCSAEQIAAMLPPLDQAVDEARRRGPPIFVGEFGAYSAAPLDSRVRYLRAMRQAMADRSMPWFYWELAAGFGLYDPEAGRFRPGVREALFAET